MTRARDYRKLSPSFDRFEAVMTIADPNASPKKKKLARVRFAIEMLEDLSSFTRRSTPTWPAYARDEGEIREAYEAPDSEHKQRIRRIWGRHRADVTEVEAENCSRLGALLYARDSLMQAGDGAAVKLIAELDRHLRAQFGVAPSDPPRGTIEQIRWARAKTRDYSALPRGLRAL